MKFSFFLSLCNQCKQLCFLWVTYLSIGVFIVESPRFFRSVLLDWSDSPERRLQLSTLRRGSDTCFLKHHSPGPVSHIYIYIKVLQMTLLWSLVWRPLWWWPKFLAPLNIPSTETIQYILAKPQKAKMSIAMGKWKLIYQHLSLPFSYTKRYKKR